MSKPPTGRRPTTTIGIWVETRELLEKVCVVNRRTPQEQFAYWTEQEARELGIDETGAGGIEPRGRSTA